MRVAMLVNSFPDISEKFIINQICGLVDAGLEPEVFAAMAGRAQTRHALVDRYSLEEKAVYAGIPRSVYKRAIKAPALLGSCLVADPAAALRALRFGTYTTAARNLKTLYFLRAFGHRRYDLLHCQFGPNGLVGAFLKDAGRADRLVVTFHGSDINGYPRRYGETVYRALYDRADAITCGTRFIRDKLVANGCPEGKISVIPVGVRMEEYPESCEGREYRDEGLILSVGRLVEVKGFRYAVEAFARIAPKFPKARYAIAGGGPDRSLLEGLARELGLADRVLLLGEKSDVEVAELYRRASVFVLPSVRASNGAEEGQGLVLQEAQASALPVVSTLVGGIPEGVLEGESGFLVPEKDPPALADRMGQLLADSALRERMGRAGRAFVAANYDMSALTGRLLGIYRDLAGESGA
jgi:colanic acid/amylovoran biosynthesis glycosyltransferase